MVATLVRGIADSDSMSQVTADRAAAYPDATQLKDYRNYLLGYQLDPRTTAQQAMFPELAAHNFCDNVCRRVVLTPANRLTIARFDVDGNDAAVNDIQEFIGGLRTLNHLPRLVSGVNVSTLRDGDHVVSLRWVKGAVRFIRESWWNGEDGTFVAYDDDDLPKYVVKEWSETVDRQTVHRRVLWYPERIERYRSADGNAWEIYNQPGDPYQGGQPVPWTIPRYVNGPMEPGEEPIGLMAVHFANRLVPNDGPGGARGRPSDSPYGVSLLAGGVLGIQDRINLIQFDIISTSSFTGTQMLWLTGGDFPTDPVTKLPVPYQVVPGAVLVNGNPDARFGAFPAGSIAAHVQALAVYKEAVAQATGLPYVVLSGNWPSGEALTRAEADLAELVDKFGENQGPGYASLLHKATRLVNVFGKLGLDEAAPIAVVFASAQRSSPLAVAAQLVQLANVEGRREALRDIGKQPEQIEQIMQEVMDDEAFAAGVATATAPGDAGATALAAELNQQGG